MNDGCLPTPVKYPLSVSESPKNTIWEKFAALAGAQMTSPAPNTATVRVAIVNARAIGRRRNLGKDDCNCVSFLSCICRYCAVNIFHPAIVVNQTP